MMLSDFFTLLLPAAFAEYIFVKEFIIEKLALENTLREFNKNTSIQIGKHKITHEVKIEAIKSDKLIKD